MFTWLYSNNLLTEFLAEKLRTWWQVRKRLVVNKPIVWLLQTLSGGVTEPEMSNVSLSVLRQTVWTELQYGTGTKLKETVGL